MLQNIKSGCLGTTQPPPPTATTTVPPTKTTVPVVVEWQALDIYEYNMLKTRRRILRQEQTESKQEMARLDSAYRLHVTEEQRIRMEEKQAALDVEAAKKRLARIRNRLEEQHSLTSSVKDQKDLADTKLNMIKSTLATICQQADKAGVLASAAAAEVQQTGGGGGGRS